MVNKEPKTFKKTHSDGDRAKHKKQEEFTLYGWNACMSAFKKRPESLLRLFFSRARASELKKVNSKLTYLANHDTLTKVPNRYYFKHSLKQMMSSADRHQYSVALMFLDLDGFKKVNDDFGHAQGDAVLVEAANRLVSLSREEDVVARLGGDEFAMILGDITNISYVELVANRILSELSRDYDFIQGGGSISVSIGIALYSEKSKDIDTLIKHADEAMYDIKDSCKNSFKIYK